MDSRIKGLDGVRAVAIVLVFLGHKAALGRQFGAGEFGVRLFFVLSGFLIIRILYGQRRKIEAGKSDFIKEWIRFNIRRAFRILPPYLALVAVAAVAFHLNRWLILRFVTYAENLDIAFDTFTYPPGGPHFWSLCVEAQFYLLAAPLLLATACNKMKNVCWAAFVLAVIYTAALWSVGFPLRSLYVGPSNFGLMALGGIFALTPPNPKTSSLAAALAFTLYLGISADSSWLTSDRWFLISSFVIAPAVAAFAIASIAANPTSKLTLFLESAPIRGLGRISYMFYLVQPFVEIDALFPHLPSAALAVVDFGLAVAVSMLSWSLFEAPLLAYGRSLASSRPSEELEFAAYLQ